MIMTVINYLHWTNKHYTDNISLFSSRGIKLDQELLIFQVNDIKLENLRNWKTVSWHFNINNIHNTPGRKLRGTEK